VVSPFQTAIGEILPTTVTPYPCPCYATALTTKNHATGGEPPSNPGNRFFPPGGPPSLPPNVVSPSSRWHVGSRPQRRLHAAPIGGPRWAGYLRGRVRVPDLGRNSLPRPS
jgi:hypothetical protein